MSLSDAASWTGAFSSWTQTPSFTEELGIAVPVVLQPLLGLDFVPYLPRAETEETASIIDESGRLTEDELEELNLVVPQDSVQSGSSRDSPASEPDLSSISQFHTLEPLVTGEPSQSLQNPVGQSNVRRRWKPRGNIISKVRGKLESRRSARKENRRRTSSWASGDTSSPNSGEPKPSSDPQHSMDASMQWLQEQQLVLERHQINLQQVQSEAHAMEERAKEIQKRMGQTQTEVQNLQKALAIAQQRLRDDLVDFQQAQTKLARLESAAVKAQKVVLESLGNLQHQPVRPRAFSGTQRQHSDVIELNLDGTPITTSPDAPLQIANHKAILRNSMTTPITPAVRVDSFMRVHDLNLPSNPDSDLIPSVSASCSDLTHASTTTSSQNGDFLLVGTNLTPILKNLTELGYNIAVDESKRFVPTRDTEKLLSKYSKGNQNDNVLGDWPIRDWQLAHDTDVLVWTGETGTPGFGSDWPVIKARGLVQTSPRELVQFMMDSSRIKEYSKMSAGREDLLRIQCGLDTLAHESAFGFPGDCKIVRALNRPRFLPTTIETMSLSYSKPIETSPGSYITVIRSVFEDDSGEHKSPSANTVRSEMLLGVLLFRPANANETVCEFTTITHVYSPGVPEMIARRVAPGSAYNMMKDVQAVFQPK
eukprot:Nitzschia sp. Nitz4//scaffold25_size161228//34569//36521//NITZ4_002419-RA/size161228-processed-gene-0.40-mRNA-1//1//CDS//3329544553//6228//frame0